MYLKFYILIFFQPRYQNRKLSQTTIIDYYHRLLSQPTIIDYYYKLLSQIIIIEYCHRLLSQTTIIEYYHRLLSQTTIKLLSNYYHRKHIRPTTYYITNLYDQLLARQQIRMEPCKFSNQSLNSICTKQDRQFGLFQKENLII